MYNTQELHEDSIPVGVNIPVTFLKCAYRHGRSFKTGETWYSLDFLFEHDENTREDGVLVHKAFQPKPDKYFEKREYSIFLSEILNSLAGKNEWSEIKNSRESWEDFYTNYLKRIDRYRNKPMYIKTIACPYFRDKNKYIACLAENNFISESPDLEYTYLEYNEVEEWLKDSNYPGKITTTEPEMRVVKGATKEWSKIDVEANGSKKKRYVDSGSDSGGNVVASKRNKQDTKNIKREIKDIDF